jgi:hypothetical protein
VKGRSMSSEARVTERGGKGENMKKIITIFGIGIIVIVFIYAFLLYFVTYTKNGEIYDGVGRLLTESPLIIRVIFGHDRLWAGLLWFISDWIVIFGGIALGAWVTRRGDY